MAKKQTRNSDTAKGGGYGYHLVRSKILKGKDGYGKVISVDREKMVKKLGRDPGPDVVVQHKEGGAHKDKDGDDFKIGTRSENTAESNKARAKKVRARLRKN